MFGDAVFVAVMPPAPPAPSHPAHKREIPTRRPQETRKSKPQGKKR
jgi:hypothetical protein